MTKHPHNPLIHLSANELLKLRDAKGTLIQCHRGTLWITQANDTKDVIVRAGQSFEVERQGLALACSFKGAVLAVVNPGEPAFLPARAAPLNESAPQTAYYDDLRVSPGDAQLGNRALAGTVTLFAPKYRAPACCQRHGRPS